MEQPSQRRARWTLALLTLIYVVNFVDRQLVGVLGQPMKAELGLSDTQLGLLGGVAFALFYTLLGLPVARLAERRSRVGIVTASLAVWSAMTAACGLAAGFGQLMLARIGVGIGEAGCVPSSQSLVADLFPPERRATALSLLSLGMPIGMLIGAVAGGWIGQALGWRAGFMALGLPGLLLAAIALLILREPARGQATRPVAAVPPLGQVVRTLLSRPAFLHMAAGATLSSFAGYALTGFAVPLAIRSYGLSLGEAATGYGIVAGTGIGLGVGMGGWMADLFRSRRPDAAALVCAAGVAIAAILFQLALSQPTPLLFAAVAVVPLIGAHLYFGPVYGFTANSVGPHERATAIAILIMVMNGIGLGLGPLAIGALSDGLMHAAGGAVAACTPARTDVVCRTLSADALKLALRVDLLVYPWAAVHFLLAGRAIRRDQSPSSAR